MLPVGGSRLAVPCPAGALAFSGATPSTLDRPEPFRGARPDARRGRARREIPELN